MGHGMQTLAQEHLVDFGDGTLILSPMNILPKSIETFSRKVGKLNGKILIDPQLYYPRKYQKNLTQYSYWPQSEYTVLETGGFDSIVKDLSELNYSAGTDMLILPSFTTKKIDDLWDKIQRSAIESGKRYADDSKLLHTISLSSDILNDEAKVEKIVLYVEKWEVEGVYIVCEHPDGYYLIDKPLWVSNLLSLVAGIKRLKKKVIVGYASHQMLCLAMAKCDAIASGNYLNVRWFQPEHFETLESDKISRRATWYYCPQALSEFKVPFLDIAKRMNLLDKMAPPSPMQNAYCDMLFSGGLPSSTGYSEKEAHRHYLYCLRKQCQMSVRDSYQETKDAHLVLLETAEQLLNGLWGKGIKGQNRDFMEIIDVNRAAISAYDMAYQFPMELEWNTL